MMARVRTATRWLLMVGLQVPAFLSLQSCKNDRTEPVKTQAEDTRQRPVFGGEPDGGRPERRGPTSRSSPRPSVERSRAEVRVRTADPVGSKSRAASNEGHGRPVKDAGERSVGDGGVKIASNRAQRDLAAERFLHYQPPGSSVGDSGERAPRIGEPQISESTKLFRDLIRRWADTLLTRDLQGHLSLYAATLDRFNGSLNVARETVRASKQRLLSGLAGVRQFEIHEVRLLPSRDGSVIAEFRIESDAAARGVVGWYRLHLRYVDDHWKIYGEEKVEPVSRRGGH